MIGTIINVIVKSTKTTTVYHEPINEVQVTVKFQCLKSVHELKSLAGAWAEVTELELGDYNE